MTTSATRKIAATCAVLGLATIGIAAAPKPANAWWHHYGYGWWGRRRRVPSAGRRGASAGLLPAQTYYAPPAQAYYAPPSRAWIPAHWQNGYWVPGHWS